MDIKKEAFVAVRNWNHKKSWFNFKDVYRHCFESPAWFGFRVWRIIRNTLNGLYKDMEQYGIEKGYIKW